MESPIIAICARDLTSAQQMLDIARANGIKKGSITGIRNKIMVLLVDSKKIETIVAKDGKILLPDEYIREMFQLANEKLIQSRERFETLRTGIEKNLDKI